MTEEGGGASFIVRSLFWTRDAVDRLVREGCVEAGLLVEAVFDFLEFLAEFGYVFLDSFWFFFVYDCSFE